jgi:hypothetical protein
VPTSSACGLGGDAWRQWQLFLEHLGSLLLLEQTLGGAALNRLDVSTFRRSTGSSAPPSTIDHIMETYLLLSGAHCLGTPTGAVHNTGHA